MNNEQIIDELTSTISTTASGEGGDSDEVVALLLAVAEIQATEAFGDEWKLCTCFASDGTCAACCAAEIRDEVEA